MQPDFLMRKGGKVHTVLFPDSQADFSSFSIKKSGFTQTMFHLLSFFIRIIEGGPVFSSPLRKIPPSGKRPLVFAPFGKSKVAKMDEKLIIIINKLVEKLQLCGKQLLFT
jgi:hypothetical protein